MTRFLRAWFPTTATTAQPSRSTRPRFKPAVERLDDRINPTLGFDPAQSVIVDPAPFAGAVGDFDGDGREDFVTANVNNEDITLRLNITPNGSSTLIFAPKQTFLAGGNDPTAISVADYNGDGRPDIATANFGSNSVSVLLNTSPHGASAVSFAPPQTFAVGTAPIDIKAVDVNSDGRADLVVTNNGNNTGTTVSVLLNTTDMHAPTASFSPQVAFTVGTGPRGLTSGDFNGDGRADIAVANVGTGSTSVSVLLNTTTIGAATPTFATKQDFTVGANPASIAAGDLNGDGRLDLAVANSGTTTVSVLLNTTAAGSPTATFATKVDVTVGTTPAGVKIDDFDGDGVNDLVVANTGANTASVVRNTTAPGGATATFAAKQDFTVGTGPNDIIVGDFDRDGRPDFGAVLYNGTAGTSVAVVRNTSTNVLPTTSSPALVVQKGTSEGVWAYKRDTGVWVQLTGANSNALAASASGNVIASFGGNGVWYYRAANQTWTQINGFPAVALAIDPLGNGYISFAGVGTYMYRLATSGGAGGGFEQIGASVPDKLAAAANGDVVGNFPGFGVYRYQRTAPIPFHQINGFNATSLDVDRNGYVVANFGGGFGVGQYIPYATGWRTIAPATTATDVTVDGYGNVYASFAGYGVGKFDHTNTWKNIAPGATANTLAADWYGNVFASFSGFQGVWEYNPFYGWNWKYQSPVTLVSLAK